MKTFHILALVKDQPTCDEIAATLRKGDLLLRIRRVSSINDLKACLDQQTWDLIITDNEHLEINLYDSLKLLVPLANKPQVIILSIYFDQTDKENLTQKGVFAFVSPDDPFSLLHETKKALWYQYYHNKNQTLKASLQQLTLEAKELHHQHHEATAYLVDGVIINCNERFAAHFGFTDCDELDCNALIDFVRNEDQQAFRFFTKQFLEAQQNPSQSFHFINQHNSPFEAKIDLSTSQLEDEPCLKLKLHPVSQSSSQANSLGNPLANLSSQGKAITLEEENATLTLIFFNNYNELRLTNTLSQLQQLKNTLITSAESHFSCMQPTSLADDCFAFVSALDINQADEAVRHAFTLTPFKDRPLFAVQTPIDEDFDIALIESSLQFALTQSTNSHSILRYQPKKDTYHEKSQADHTEIEKELRYQPLLNLSNNDQESYEVSLSHSVPQTTHTALEINQFIIIESTKALNEKENKSNCRLFINLFAIHKLNSDFLQWLNVVIKAGAFSQQNIIFQIDYAEIQHHMQKSQSFIEALKESGFQVAIKDIQVNDASIDLLTTLACHFVSLDYKLIAEETVSLDHIKNFIEQLNQRDIKHIIHGVENAIDMSQVWQLGIHFISGNYVEPPSSMMDFNFNDIT